MPGERVQEMGGHGRKRQQVPVIRTTVDGTAMTGHKMNEILKELLTPHLGTGKGKITTHSFRAGIATLLAGKGFDDEEIMSVGRWHSRAFEAYIKKPRTKRASIAKRVAEMTD